MTTLAEHLVERIREAERMVGEGAGAELLVRPVLVAFARELGGREMHALLEREASALEGIAREPLP